MKKIPLATPTMHTEEQQYIQKAFETNWISKGKMTGTFGDYGIYSFNGNKIITTSGGGILVAQQEKDVEKARFLSRQARDPARHYQHSTTGYNYRMSNIVAGIGCGQMQYLEEHIQKKHEIYKAYKDAFSDIKEIEMNPLNKAGIDNNWLSCMTISADSDVTPTQVMDVLEAENIETRPIWKPMHMQPVFEEYDFIQVEDGMSVSEDIFSRGLCLPSDIKNTREDMERIIKVVRKQFGQQ